MSSTRYSTELVPDPALRRLVLVSGVLAAVGGMVMLAGLQLEWYWRALAGVAWGLLNGRNLWHIAQGNKSCERLQIDERGAIHLLDEAGCCTPATIAAGSVVLPRIAWLRMRTGTGRPHVELVRRRSARSHEWRRLRVIWRHLGAHP